MTRFGDDFLDDYFAESDEHLAAIRHALLELETSIGDDSPPPHVTEELFRAYHSLKGLAGMVEDRHTEQLAHEMESYLLTLREGTAVLATDGVNALIEGTQALERAVSAHRDGVAPPDATAVLDRLQDLVKAGSSGTSSRSPVSDVLPPVQQELWECIFTPSPPLSSRGVNVNEVRSRLQAFGAITSAVPQVGDDGGVAFRFQFTGPVEPALVEQWRSDGMVCAPSASALSLSEPVEAAELTAVDAPQTARSAGHYVRVDLARLDDLMRMIGDMVILRARLADALGRVEERIPVHEWRPIHENAVAIERQLRDLREGIVRVRLVAVGEIFRRMPFVVRDLARELDRRVHVSLSGQETQIDKYLVERMMDPVLHLVRNAVSHGLETPAERIEAGKPPDGTVSLTARASGEMVTIEIADDGRGVVVDRVLARAAQAGLAVPRATDIDDTALLDLLCSPGFSTRDEADRVSGRGFGMAVVRRTVQEMGGALRMVSRPGHGTSFTIELPLTLAISDALIAAVGGHIFAIPQNAVREVIEIEAAALRTLEGGEAVAFRGQALPVVRLSSVFGLQNDNRTRYHALLVPSGGGVTALMVDRVVSQREIVVRTTTDPLIRVDGIAGATDLGDGRAVLILDVAAVVRATRGGQRHRAPRGAREIA